jgi:hypothetical protein
VRLHLLALLAATTLASGAATQTAPAPMWLEMRGQGVCYSQLGWCPLRNPERTPVGIPCYCVLPDNRYVAGTTSPLWYRGRVSPAGPPPPPPPPPPNLNEQGMPWFTRPQGMPGMPWFFRPPPPARPRQCRVAFWYPAQYWHTDQWGHTVTWTNYAPLYVCD